MIKEITYRIWANILPHKFVFAGNSKVKPIILLENIKHPTQGITRHCQPSRWNWSLSIKCNRSKVSSQTLLQGKEDVSFAKLHNVLLVWHGNRYTAIRAVGNIYTKSYCSILQQVRFKQKENKVYPSILNRIQEYYQQRTSCQTMIAMAVNQKITLAHWSEDQEILSLQ